jgi:hypothetical protein
LRYILRTLIGLSVMVASITLISYAVFQLLQIGTCASGGPYEVARECPPGTERIMFAIFPAVLVMLGAAALYASRGTPPGSDDKASGASALLWIWSGLFLGIAFACFWGVWGPNANPGPGGDLGGLIVGFLFVPMGLAPLVFALLGLRDGRKARTPATGAEPAQGLMRSLGTTVVRSAPKPTGFGTPPAPSGAGGGDKVARLEQLEKLRRDGVVTDAEFERLKQEILGG